MILRPKRWNQKITSEIKEALYLSYNPHKIGMGIVLLIKTHGVVMVQMYPKTIRDVSKSLQITLNQNHLINRIEIYGKACISRFKVTIFHIFAYAEHI